MKKLVYALCMVFVFLLGCDDDEKSNPEVGSPVAGKKIAYIINMAPSPIFRLCADRSQEVAYALGMSCDAFFSDGDDEAFRQQIEACASKGYDGLFLSHGGRSYSYAFLSDLLQRYPQLKIVTFDTILEDAQGKERTLEGVTQFFQDDADLAAKLLDYACDVLAPSQKPVKVLKVWVGPDYLGAFDRRDVGYQSFEEAGKIQTVAVIGPKDLSNACVSMQEVMEETLEKYEETDIDAIWVAYDLYARGCYPALKASGKQIPLVSVDICQEDVAFMKEENSLWKACACTDFEANGEQGVRILALELAGEYESITSPGSDVPTNYLEMPASLITQQHVLNNETPETYGDPSYFVTNVWLKQYLGN